MIALVTGGASCGKSAYAEEIACSLPGIRYYLAAMRPFGEEGAQRIKRHRAMRAGKGFETVECFDGLQTLPAVAENESGPTTALLESLGNVVANELFSDDGTCAPYEETLKAVLDGVAHAASLFDNLVIVGDEVGSDGLRYDEATETYIELIGAASCAIAAKCDLVVECIAGQPFAIKGELSPFRGDSLHDDGSAAEGVAPTAAA